MEEVVVVETFDRYHRVRDRIKFHRLPATIGRAYDNDIILDDPYVSPHHARIERTSAGQVLIADLHSTNGLFDLSEPRQRADLITVDDETRVRLGRTLLRIRTPRYAVSQTRVERLGSITLDALLNSRTVFLTVLAVFAAVQFTDSYLISYEDRNPGRVFFDSVLPFIGFIWLWAGVWAVFSRLNYHQSYFFPHGTVVTVALLAITAVDFIEKILRFGLGADPSNPVVDSIKIAAFAFPLLYAHLRFVSSRSPRRVARYSAIMIAVLSTLFLGSTLVYQNEFTSEPEYMATLLPAHFQFVPSKSLEEWGESLSSIEEQVIADVERAQE